MKNVKFLSLDYNMVDVPEQKIDGQIFVHGAKWADPKEEHFKSRLKKFRKSPGPPEEWALTAAPKIAEEFSLRNIFSIYDEELGGVIDRS
jgi:hypothetical protein